MKPQLYIHKHRTGRVENIRAGRNEPTRLLLAAHEIQVVETIDLEFLEIEEIYMAGITALKEEAAKRAAEGAERMASFNVAGAIMSGPNGDACSAVAKAQIDHNTAA